MATSSAVDVSPNLVHARTSLLATILFCHLSLHAPLLAMASPTYPSINFVSRGTASDTTYWSMM